MKKVIKIIVGIIVFVLILVVALVATSPLWLGPVIKSVANAATPKITGTAFNLGQASVNPFSLRCEFGALTLANPEGFKEANAVTLGRFNVDVDTASTMSDVLVIEDISVEDLCVALVSNDEGKGNFDIIADNAAKALGKDKAEPAQAEPEKAEPEKAEAPKDKKPLKIIITRLNLKNLKVKKGPLTIPCPSIELHDLGKDSGGYEPAQMGQAILKEVWANIMAAGTDVLKLGTSALDAAKGATEAANTALKGTTDAAADAASAATDAAKNAANATTDAVKGAAGAATDAVKGAGDALKGLFK